MTSNSSIIIIFWTEHLCWNISFLFQKCDICQRAGATVGCCTRGCPANYHFMCARMDGCLFQDDKKVFCSPHKEKVDGEVNAFL